MLQKLDLILLCKKTQAWRNERQYELSAIMGLQLPPRQVALNEFLTDAEIGNMAPPEGQAVTTALIMQILEKINWTTYMKVGGARGHFCGTGSHD